MRSEHPEPSYEEAIASLRTRLDEPVDARLLDDVQRRVRRALADERVTRRPHRGLAIGLAAAIAVVAGGIVVFALRRPPQPAPVAVHPGMQVEVDGATTTEPLTGHRLVVAARARAFVTLPEGARIEVNGPARINGTDGGRFVLESGRAHVNVEKQAPGHEVVLGMGDATVTVHGTSFVMVAEDGRGLGLSVEEGVVEVTLANTPSTMLHAGERWDRPAPPQPAMPSPGPEPKTVTPTVPSSVSSKKPKTNLRVAAEQAMARRDCEETRVLIGRYIAETPEVAEQARAAMLEAECWLRVNDKQRALPVLDRIATDYAGQPGAQSALFEAATARAELKQSAEAVAGFDAYLTRYPKGTFAEPAAFRRCELINQLNGHRDGAVCLTAFAERFPKGRRAGDALLLVGSLGCADERYPDASRAYWSYLERVAPERDDVANLESLVRCLERAKTPDAASARDAFTKRHPAKTTP